MSNMTNFKFALRDDLKEEKHFLPNKAEPFATGYDVRAAQKDKKPLIITPGEYFKIPLGFRVLPQEGWWFQLNPRSSSFTKKHMHNLIGIIDEHYNHEVLFAGQYLPEIVKFGFYNENEERLIINFGDPIGQIIPFKRIDMSIIEINNMEYDDLCKQRMGVRDGGFGSTDKIK